MINIRIAWLLLLIFLWQGNGVAQIAFDSLLTETEAIIESMPTGFAISIAIIKGKEVEFVGFRKEKSRFVTSDLKDSLFEIGSFTKVFTSTVLAKHVLDGKLLLADQINEVFPYPLNDSLELNYVSLANHTSGLPRLPGNLMPLLFTNISNPYSEYSYKMFDDFLENDLKLQDSDSMNYSYSNLGAGLLSYALAKSANTEFEKLLKVSVFNKYGMNSSSYNKATSIRGIVSEDNEAENWQFGALKGAGGLVSTTNDLSKFILGQFDPKNEELLLTRKETFSVSDKMSIGLAWHILDSQSGEKIFWHNGGTGGFTSSVSMRMDNKTAVIILSNISAINPKSKNIDKLCFSLLDILEKD